MHWTQGGFDDDQPLSSLVTYFVPYWLVTATAAALSYYAGWRMEERAKANPLPAPAAAGPSPAATSDFAEQMRAAQERARGPEAPSPSPSPEPEPPAKP